MTALRRPEGTTSSSRRVMKKVIYDFYSKLFDSHVHLPPCHLREDGYVIPSVLPPTCHLVGEESFSARPRQDSTRTSEESTGNVCEHIC
ncbi:hypothetical protein Y032_0883g2843 [Ancylostoma ceylanicum]|uniref:Uncharacterized protein n=1 Tax=Ancylostoma ceylanicum TaxID=53326 RepID=A0A016WBC3_9BILA|nr:hypothetical protein Y032_0883g2843 [Ancylostoma ceylanicum]